MTRPAKNIIKPKRYTTARGGQFIRPVDIIRSKTGRRVIARHAVLAPLRELFGADAEGISAAKEATVAGKEAITQEVILKVNKAK